MSAYTWMILTDEDRPKLVAHGFDPCRADKPITAIDQAEALREFALMLSDRNLIAERIEFVEKTRNHNGANFRAWTRPIADRAAA